MSITLDDFTVTIPSAVSPSLRCRIVTTTQELAEIEPDWLDLLGRSMADAVMLSPTWLCAWWELYGAGRELRVILWYDGERLVGLAPLARRRVWHFGVLPLRRLEFLGSDQDEKDAICSEYLNVIAECGAEARIAQALAQELVKGSLGTWDELWLPVMAGDGCMPDLLTAALRQVGLPAVKSDGLAAAFLPLPKTWEAYLSYLPRKRRKDLLHKLEDFEAWTGGDYQVHRATCPDELDEGWLILRSLHSERWASEGAFGVFQSPRYEAFHRRVTEELLAQGALDLHWLVARGEAIAASYSLVWKGKVSGYQSGRKVDVPPTVRPSTVLQALAIRRYIEEGQREFDFLGDATRYKLNFGAVLRPIVQVRAARPGWREFTRCLLEQARSQARRMRNGWRRFREAKPAPAASEKE